MNTNDLAPNTPPATQGTDPNLPNQGWNQGAQGRQAQGSQTAPQGTAEQVKDEAKNLANQAKEQTRNVAGQAKEQVNQVVSQRKEETAQRLGSFAHALHEAASKLDEEDAGGLGRYAHQAADQVDRLSNYLRNQDMSAFMRDTETFARRHPDVFLGTTFLAGLLVARFFKASNDRRDDREGYPAQAYAPTGYAATGAYDTTGSGYGNTSGNDRPYTTERYPGTGTGDALVNPRPFEDTGV
jgi:gas vesicle protein